MEHFVIHGGKPLCGTVEISGAKNAVLPIMAATVLHGGTYFLRNCPAITDVTLAAQIVESLGGKVLREGNSLLVDTRQIEHWVIPGELMSRMRASILFLGSLLARFGKAVLTMPGGCPLGRRPIDLHLDALAQMGASVTLFEGQILCEAPALHGCEIQLLFPSVGATENILLAATACRGAVTIRNAAREPEITDLICFLQSMGADIQGAGTDTLRVLGGAPLHHAAHAILPDRIETATYLCAAAACGGQVTLRGTESQYIEPVITCLTAAGCEIKQGAYGLEIRRDGPLRAIAPVETAPYPGFPTDAQALLMAALLRAEGSTRFSENIFERRFSHVEQMRRFGARIETGGPTALVTGVPELFAAEVEGCDLRASAALIVTALQAQGESFVFGLKHLYRGYDNLEGKLCALGAEIWPVQ